MRGGTLSGVSAPESLLLIEASPLAEGCALVVEARDGERYILWPGEAPSAPRPPHPGIARLAGHGSGLWAERLPARSCRLPALPAPLDEMEAAELFALIADALSALHASAQAHGALDASHVALDAQGAPVLLGAGQRFAEPQHDLAALARMWDAWCPLGPLLDLRSAASLAASLRMWLSVSGEPPTSTLPALIAAALPPPLPGASPITVPWTSPAEAVDEIGVNIGPDEAERGLLDPLTWSGLTGEPTNELTASDFGEEDTRIDAPQAAVMARLLQAAHQPPDASRFADQEGIPSSAVQALLEQEPLDILPSPEAHMLSANAAAWDEHTATAVHGKDPPTATAFTPPINTASAAAAAPRPRGELSVSVLAAAVALALVAGAAGVWLLLTYLT